MVNLVLVAAKREAALMTGDDASRDPKAKASAVELLGGVEGFEEAGLHGGGHAVASIGDGDADARTTLGVFGRIVNGVMSGNEKAAGLSHGIDWVGDEIVGHLADIVFKAKDWGGGGVGCL